MCAAFLILFLFTNELWTYKYDRIMAIIFVRKINGAIAYDYCVKAKFIIFHEIEIICSFAAAASSSPSSHLSLSSSLILFYFSFFAWLVVCDVGCRAQIRESKGTLHYILLLLASPTNELIADNESRVRNVIRKCKCERLLAQCFGFFFLFVFNNLNTNY